MNADRTPSQSDSHTDAHDALEAEYEAEFRAYAEQSGQVACRRHHGFLGDFDSRRTCRACGAVV